MNDLDIYYRALIDYRRNTLQNRACEGQRGAAVKANAKADHVTVTRKICQVDMDWVETIEKGLVHVEKAIREDRQFIRSNGEVVDIEKVKGVSKDSVKHLAQHSNLITRYQEGEDIIPDRLYIVERLNDYAVYENKFLYMMLCYLRDFITVRYKEIVDLEHTYDAAMSMHKKIDFPKRHLTVDIDLKEIKNDDPYLARRSTSKATIDRIRDILELVHSFLATPLMEEVAKVPMIKPPVVKTNVLRMNQNFRGAMALYEYVVAYDKPGYTVMEEVQKLQPFRFDMADEFAEIILLSSFLTYEYGMNIRADLQQEYEAEEERLRQEKEKRQLEKLKALRRRIKESGESAEEYMLMLEQRNRRLEADSEQLVLSLQKIEELEQTIERMTEQGESQQGVIDQMKLDIEALHASYTKQIGELHAAHEADKQAWEDEMRALNERHAEALCEQAEEHRTASEQSDQQHAQQLTEANLHWQQQLAEEHLHWQQQREALQAAYAREQQAKNAALRDAEKNLADYRLAQARLQALRAEHGLPQQRDAEMSTRELFEEMEHQFKVFKALFDKQWKKTKRDIRKETLGAYKQAVKEGRAKEYLASILGTDAPAEKAEAPLEDGQDAVEKEQEES